MRITLAIIGAAIGFYSYAQTAEDLLRYSFQQVHGTPRTLGLAGAWGTAGADISSAAINPAGLGFYRRSELMGSAAISANYNNATYNGFNNVDTRTNFNIPNFGLVFNKVNSYKGKDATQGVVAASFAFGLNRINNFQHNQFISGNVNNSSRANALAIGATGQDSAGFWSSNEDNNLSALAWRLSLIDNNGGSKNYTSIFNKINDSAYSTSQEITRKTRGRNNEYFVAGGINISNLIYLGASVVISEIEFTNDVSYQENVTATSANNPVNAFTVNEFFRTTGSGVGAKLGVIIRPADFIRVGASYHTPVRHNLVDYYQNTMSVVFNGIRYTEPPKPREDFFEYQLITPGRLNLGGSILIQQLAIINIDYERVDYTRGRLTSQGFAFTNQNAVAKALFNNNANNIRVGAEINYADLKWRAGFAYYNSPYNTTVFRNNSGERMAVSGGIGAIINKDLFIDFAIINWFGKSYYTPYSGAETATINQSMLNISLGAGYRF